MAFSYYYVSTHPVFKTKRFFTLEEAQTLHKELWVWKSEHPNDLPEKWPKFETMGGDVPVPFMYSFACDLTKDKLGVRRCRDCPHKWIDRMTNKAIGRWHPWHWCDYPGALIAKYFEACEKEDFEKAKEIAIEISNLTLSPDYAQQVVKESELPTYPELVDRVEQLEQKNPTEVRTVRIQGVAQRRI